MLLGVSKATVERRAYRDHGLGALKPVKQLGAARKFGAAHHERLRVRLDAGPTEADGVCTLRSKDVRRIIACSSA
jgi:transposase